MMNDTNRCFEISGGRAPRDKYVLVSRQKKIEPIAYFCVSAVSLVGLLLASSFLAYNLYHRRLRYVVYCLSTFFK